MIMKPRERAVKLAIVVVLAGTTLVLAESRKDYRFKVGRHASVTVMNQYGPISVKPGAVKEVMVTATTYSDKVEVDHSQSGSRIDIVSHLLPGVDEQSGRVEYEVLVPPDASVTLHSINGPLHAERLHGDVTLEGANANVDVREISDAHVHIKTLNGLVTLTGIRDGHVEITSVGGDVVMNSVNGPLVHTAPPGKNDDVIIHEHRRPLRVALLAVIVGVRDRRGVRAADAADDPRHLSADPRPAESP